MPQMPKIPQSYKGPELHCAFNKLILVGKAIPNPKNPNTHPEAQVKLLAQIIQAQGWRAPITISKRSGFIVRGHGWLAAAQEIGCSHVPADYQDYENEAEEWADLIADNKIAELAEIDQELMNELMNDLKGLDEIGITGFDEEEIKRLEESLAIPEEGDWNSAFEKLPDGDKQPFQQMKFILHDDQVETVKEAIAAAKAKGSFDSPNENSNGNAIARICAAYLAGGEVKSEEVKGANGRSEKDHLATNSAE